MGPRRFQVGVVVGALALGTALLAWQSARDRASVRRARQAVALV